MRGRGGRSGAEQAPVVERAIVLQLLRDDHDQRWSRIELEREIVDFASAAIDVALGALAGEGVLERVGDLVWASRAIRRLDQLELISV